MATPISIALRERGPMTVAAFMDLALYDQQFGYYARAAQRSGRTGDFFTSVDVGPIFGQLLAIQIAEMAESLEARVPFDLVEAGAGNGRLSADILRALSANAPSIYDRVRLHLVEASGAARAAHPGTLAETADRLVFSGRDLPEAFEGILVANELFDAFPVHQVVMRTDGLKEVYVARRTSEGTPAEGLMTVERAPSTPALAGYLERLGVELEPGWRVEINLRAIDWIRDAARRLRRGFMILIDYGHEARELYSASHSAGTLTSFRGHRSAGPEARAPEWLQSPGDQDITSHVDFTSIRMAAEAEGMQTFALLDQTYFLMGLWPAVASQIASHQSTINKFKTLIMPGGIGSSHKVLLLGKRVGAPALKGCSFRVRVT